MKKLKKFLAIGLTTSLLAMTPVTAAAANEQYKDKFNVKQVNFVEHSQELKVYDKNNSHDFLFTAIECVEEVYITDYLNVRVAPTVNSKRIGVLDKNAKVLRVATGPYGWDIIKINNDKYFIWNEFLSTNRPKDLKKEPKLTTKLKEKKTTSNYLGKYKTTAYCQCAQCCGKWSGGPTASGTMPQQGRTIACNSLPFGTKVMIDGNVYIVEDTGHLASNVIDIFFNSHSQTKEYGVKYKDVYLIA